jgi:hypothetical protein
VVSSLASFAWALVHTAPLRWKTTVKAERMSSDTTLPYITHNIPQLDLNIELALRMQPRPLPLTPRGERLEKPYEQLIARLRERPVTVTTIVAALYNPPT